MEPTRDPVPKTTTPQTEKLRGSERKETDLTAGFHRRHTAHINVAHSQAKRALTQHNVTAVYIVKCVTP